MIRWILALVLLCSTSYAETIRVAIVDTGAPEVMVQPCISGHKDFTGTTLADVQGHATNISNVIDDYAAGADYCQIYLKYFTNGRYQLKGYDNQTSTIAAFKEAIRLKVHIIVYAGGGVESDEDETRVVKQALDAGIFVIAAAGNERMDFTKTGCKYYPACSDERVVVVGCKDLESSNKGKGVDFTTNCVKINGGGVVLSGTSQATAITVGKFVKFWDLKNKKKRK